MNKIIEIHLTQGKVALIDEEMYDRICRFTWCVYKKPRKYGYRYYARTNLPRLNGKRKTLDLHQLIMMPYDCNMDIDHADGDGLNNLKSNLRICSRRDNMRNQRKTSPKTSKYKGVYFDFKNKVFKSFIKGDKGRVNLGSYTTEEEAAVVYNEMAIELFGEYAALNIINK